MTENLLVSSCCLDSFSTAKMNQGSFQLATLKIFLIIKALFDLSIFDHSSLDYPKYFVKRFLLYYSFLSYICAKKFFFFFKSNNNTVSNYKIFPAIEWLERESYDFFGIFYLNHPDLRRILTDYGFPSFPLRKDFPVQGFFDMLYSIINKKLQMKEIEFQQGYRIFNKENPYQK